MCEWSEVPAEATGGWLEKVERGEPAEMHTCPEPAPVCLLMLTTVDSSVDGRSSVLPGLTKGTPKGGMTVAESVE